MIFVLAALVLALMWAAVTGAFTFGNLVLGGAVGVIALLLMRERIVRPTLFVKFGKAFSLLGLFLFELGKSAFKVALLVLSPNISKRLKPGIVAFPLSLKSDPEITLLANLITLTPGTLSVDVSNDRKMLYVHALSVPDREELIADIANGFEAKIMEVFE